MENIEIKEVSQKKNKLLLISMILTGLYLIYIIAYFGGILANTGVDSYEYVGGAIASALVFPHLICVFIGFIFNCLAFFMNKRAFALVAGILYAVSMVLFMIYFLFILVQMILCFVAFAKMPKSKE